MNTTENYLQEKIKKQKRNLVSVERHFMVKIDG